MRRWLSSLSAVASIPLFLSACSTRHSPDDVPVKYVGDPREIVVADRLTRFLAAPLIVIGIDIRRSAVVNVAGKHLEIYSVRVAKALRDVDDVRRLNQNIILVAAADNVGANSDGTIVADLKWTEKTRPDLTRRALFYLRRDENLDIFVPVERRAVWSIESISPTANLETLSHDVLTPEVLPDAEHRSDARIFAARYGSSARAYTNYRRSLAVCPERTLGALVRSQTHLDRRTVFATTPGLCEQPRGPLSF